MSKIAVLSGGTATNDLTDLFNNLSESVSYILPILDNGGSTSEMIRVLGGPAIGDIRARLTKLIPEDQHSIKQLLSYRLSENPREAKVQWNDIVDGSHELWRSIEPARREIFRAFFIHVNVELLKRSKHQSSALTNKKQYRFELASVGNLFLTGARIFIGSLDSAVELFSRLTSIDSRVEVLPCINTNFTYHISALLKNGLIITGQSQISHPSSDQTADNYPPPINRTRPSSPNEQSDTYKDGYFSAETSLHDNSLQSPTPLDVAPPIGNITAVNYNLSPPPSAVPSNNNSNDNSNILSDFSDNSDDEETGNIPQYTHPELKKSQLHFSKTETITPLLSPIERIFYVSPYGEEIRPTAHHKVCSTISNADMVVYSIGSLMTSILPIIVLRGVGKAISMDLTKNNNKKRVLLLNGCNDRETFGMRALDFVRIIVELATYSFKSKSKSSDNIDSIPDWNKFVSHVLYMEDPKIEVDHEGLRAKGITPVMVKRESNMVDNFDIKDLELKLTMVNNG